MPFSNPHLGIFLYWLFRFLNSVIVLIEVIYEIIIHLILKSSFLSTKSAQQTLSTNPKKRYLNSNNSQCSVTSKQNIYIKKKIFQCTPSKTHTTLPPYTHKPIDNDYWFLICTKIVMLIKTSDKRVKSWKGFVMNSSYVFTNFLHNCFFQFCVCSWKKIYWSLAVFFQFVSCKRNHYKYS